MTIKHPCNLDNTWQNYGPLRVTAIGTTPIEPGMGIFDGGGSWLLSNWDASGTMFLGENWARIEAGDVLRVETPTGHQEVTVTANNGTSGTKPNDFTSLTVSQDSFSGVLLDDQPTGVWKQRSAAVICTP